MAMTETTGKPRRRRYLQPVDLEAQTSTIGRPTKMTRFRVNAILQALRAGAPEKHAAMAAGVGYSTYAAWKAAFPDFQERVEMAQAQCVVQRLRRIERAGKAGSWQADMTVLERRHPEHFARREKVDVTLYQGIRSEAERIATELGISVAEVLEGSGVAGALPADGESAFGD
jgi:hypothetical protein